MMKIVFCLYLLAGSVWDIRTQKLPGVWIWSGCIVGGAYVFFQITAGERIVEDLLISLLPGVVCYVFAKISHAMGEGDAWLILTAGLVLSFYDLAKVLSVAFFLSAAGSIVCLIAERNIKNRRIPFVPFLFLAAGMVLMG